MPSHFTPAPPLQCASRAGPTVLHASGLLVAMKQAQAAQPSPSPSMDLQLPVTLLRRRLMSLGRQQPMLITYHTHVWVRGVVPPWGTFPWTWCVLSCKGHPLAAFLRLLAVFDCHCESDHVASKFPTKAPRFWYLGAMICSIPAPEDSMDDQNLPP